MTTQLKQSSWNDFWTTGPQTNFTSLLYSLLGNFYLPDKNSGASGVGLVSFEDCRKWEEAKFNHRTTSVIEVNLRVLTLFFAWQESRFRPKIPFKVYWWRHIVSWHSIYFNTRVLGLQ